jgi:hypothetical protein|tara:strand:- start:431 stop:733 length:303 start_codon:yes stop_codon:yes gene_type:complete
MTIEHNDLKKGTRVKMTPFYLISNELRSGVLIDNMKGITRLVHIDEENGYFPDMGSVYVDEIIGYFNEETDRWEAIKLNNKHFKQLEKIRIMLGDRYGNL